jgi:hypothetical protein
MCVFVSAHVTDTEDDDVCRYRVEVRKGADREAFADRLRLSLVSALVTSIPPALHTDIASSLAINQV